MKKSLWIALSLFAVLVQFKVQESPPFTLDHISSEDVGGENCFELSEVLPLLNQPFKYLGHGTQAIAFVSQDGGTVLKFFLKKKIGGKKTVSFLKLIPAYRHAKEKSKQERHHRVLLKALKRYALAYHDMREETAMIALHSRATKDLFPPCTLSDPSGKEWAVDLDRVPFIVQKRVAPMEEVFSQLATAEEREKAIRSSVALFRTRAEKGYCDKRSEFHIDNYGFLGDKVILLDPGRIQFSEEIKRNPEPEIAKMEERLLRKLSH